MSTAPESETKPPPAPATPQAATPATPQAAEPLKSRAAEPIPKGIGPRAFLAITALLVLAWFAWLGTTALNKSRAPAVSRAQAAVAPIPVRAKLTADDKGKPKREVKVVEALTPGGPKPDKELLVTNLPDARGFEGEGEYLLLLAAEPNPFLPDEPLYHVVALRTSSADTDPPPIYKWSDDVATQAKRLYRGAK